MIVEIYRGNGLTELINLEGSNEYADWMEKSSKADQPGSGNMDVPDANSRNNGKVKGCFVGRDGVAVLLDHLCGCRWKGKQWKLRN